MTPVKYKIGRRLIICGANILQRPSMFCLSCQCKRESQADLTVSRRHTYSTTTIDEEELKRFRSLSQKWWSGGGPYTALHTMNKLRIPLIKSALTGSTTSKNPLPLKGLNILDVGCGGGVLSEPLSRLGATVVGLDALQENIDAALDRQHCIKDPLVDSNLQYVCSTVEDYVNERENSFDAVVASEVVEHVSSLDTFIKSCVDLTKVGGSLIFTTINKTSLSYALAIIAAEYVFRLAPQGTHDWNKFVSPDTLRDLLEKNSCQQKLIHGMTLNPCDSSWSWIANTDVNYAATFVKLSQS